MEIMFECCDCCLYVQTGVPFLTIWRVETLSNTRICTEKLRFWWILHRKQNILEGRICLCV